MRTRIQRWGNSLALRIPKSFATHSNIEQGSFVDLSIVKGRLIIEPVSDSEFSLDELLAGVSEANTHSEIDTGTPVGKEVS